MLLRRGDQSAKIPVVVDLLDRPVALRLLRALFKRIQQINPEIPVRRLSLLTVLAIGLVTTSFAQEQVVERAAKGPPNKDIRIGVYLNVQPDCTSGPLPTIRLLSQPEHGKVTVKPGKISATNYRQCLALQVPALVAFYRSAAGFSGTDTLTLEIKFSNGRVEIQKIILTVQESTREQI